MISGALEDFIDFLPGSVVLGGSALSTPFTGVSIDSRTTAPGNMFIAIEGDRHDGHDFVQQAISRGADVVVVGREKMHLAGEHSRTAFVGVHHTLQAMQQLARHYLDTINPYRIALTGTNGKTTCKSLISSILSSKYRTCSTRGNLNNQFGVPLSIFEFAANCEVAVFEFAMSTPGEIARLVELVAPNVRVILNVGPAHLQTMKTIDAIAEAKFEILQNAKQSDWAVLNMDDPNIRSRSYRYRINKIAFGMANEHEVHPERVFSNGAGRAHMIYEGEEIVLPILGTHHVSNVLAAIAVARIMDVPFSAVKSGIESFVPLRDRMSSEDIRGVIVINDAYNANPASVTGALDTVASMAVAGKRVVVLGDMLELGAGAEEYHRQVAVKLAGSNVSLAILVGKYAEIVREAALAAGLQADQIVVLADYDEIVDLLSRVLSPGDLLLLKASRALEFERIEQGIKALLGRRN